MRDVFFTSNVEVRQFRQNFVHGKQAEAGESSSFGNFTPNEFLREDYRGCTGNLGAVILFCNKDPVEGLWFSLPCGSLQTYSYAAPR